jgi:hypothetical protein
MDLTPLLNSLMPLDERFYHAEDFGGLNPGIEGHRQSLSVAAFE